MTRGIGEPTRPGPAGSGVPTEAALDELRATLPGQVLRPGDTGWDGVRRRLGLDPHRPPVALVTVADEEDVVAAAAWSWRYGLDVSAHRDRAGAGGAVVLDTAGLHRLVVDPNRRSARVGAAVTCAALLDACAPYGLTSVTGAGRHPGDDRLSRCVTTDGCTVHTILGVDLVDPRGERRWVTATSDARLFRLLAGGADRLGVVVGLDVVLRPVDAV